MQFATASVWDFHGTTYGATNGETLLTTNLAISGATYGVNSIVTCGACPIRPSGSARPTRPSSSVAWFLAPNRPPANFLCFIDIIPPLCRFFPPSHPVLFPPSVSLSLSLSLFLSPSSSCFRGFANYTCQEREIYPQWGYDRRRRGRVSRVWDIHVG